VSKDAAVFEQSYRFALDVRPAQEAVLDSWLGASRYWFNRALSEVKDRLDRRAAGQDVNVPWSYRALCSELDAPWRNERAPWQTQLPCGTYMAGFEALGAALRNFSAGRREGRTVGFPDFKRKGRCSESVLFQRPRLLDVSHVEFTSAVGPVRVKERMTKLLRLLERDPRARVLRATLKRHGQTWYVSFTVVRSPKRRRARQPTAVVGVDVGLRRLATTHTGEVFSNPRPLQQALKRLRRLQRQLDRQRRANNSGNYLPDGRVRPGVSSWVKSGRMLETERRIARLHERVANVRREHAHLVTTALSREYGVIGAEGLHVKGMLRSKRLARHIADVGWGRILEQLAYKTAWSDGFFSQADRFYPSSKTCLSCGAVKAKLRLDETVFGCEECGARLDRDTNAAFNLAAHALQEARAEGRVVQLAAAQAARGATDPKASASRATAVNRKGPFDGPATADEDRRGRIAITPLCDREAILRRAGGS